MSVENPISPGGKLDVHGSDSHWSIPRKCRFGYAPPPPFIKHTLSSWLASTCADDVSCIHIPERRHFTPAYVFEKHECLHRRPSPLPDKGPEPILTTGKKFIAPPPSKDHPKTSKKIIPVSPSGTYEIPWQRKNMAYGADGIRGAERLSPDFTLENMLTRKGRSAPHPSPRKDNIEIESVLYFDKYSTMAKDRDFRKQFGPKATMPPVATVAKHKTFREKMEESWVREEVKCVVNLPKYPKSVVGQPSGEHLQVHPSHPSPPLSSRTSKAHK